MKATQPQEEVHEIMEFVNKHFVQATGGWKARSRHLRNLLNGHLETLERLYEKDKAAIALKRRAQPRDEVLRLSASEADQESDEEQGHDEPDSEA